MFDFMLMTIYYLGVTLGFFLIIILWGAIFAVGVHEIREIIKEARHSTADEQDLDKYFNQ